MKSVFLSMALASVLVACASGVTPPTETLAAASVDQPPLRPLGECMVARHVRDWGVIDNQRLVVRSLGERYYDIRLQHRCSALGKRPLLSFSDSLYPLPLGSGRGFRRGVGQDPVLTDGRICGDPGESVIPHGGVWTGTDLPCRIASVRRIDRGTFDGVFGKSPSQARRFLDASPSLLPGEVASH